MRLGCAGDKPAQPVWRRLRNSYSFRRFAVSTAKTLAAKVSSTEGQIRRYWKTQLTGKVSGLVANSLLLRVATGDTVAVEECIERFGGLAWSLARRFSANPSDADDAVQEIFIELWQAASRFDETIGSEATFVTMIARRCLINRFRRQRRRLQTAELPAELPATAAGQLDPVEQADEVSRVAEAMHRLRPEQQAVLRMSIYDGLSHDAIAKSMGIPLGTVKTHARRGLLQIREALSGAVQNVAKEGGT